jgi:coproporphyrinogen III oxidase-like Fe-S oxidoreductase
MQLEVGVQSFNVDVQERIARKQDNAKTEANLRWLVQPIPRRICMPI